MRDVVTVHEMPVESLRPYPGNARTHSEKQVKQIARSIERFGFTNPVLISDENEIIAGHGRVEAAKVLGLPSVPTLRLSHLSPAQRRAYTIADNKLALNAGWDRGALALELQALIDLDFDVELTGFALAEADIILGEARERPPKGKHDAADQLPPFHDGGKAVTEPGDVWLLGRHRLVCGDAQDARVLRLVMSGDEADLVFTDPYTGPIGEGISFQAFIAFLGNAAAVCRDGAIAFVCTDWRHMGELLAAGEAVFSELLNLCVWKKTTSGSGTLYRSEHELVFVFKVGTAPHTNQAGLGTGGCRTDVWDYPDVNTAKARIAERSVHPSVKPVALVADAIKDCTRPGEAVLDCFAGSGTTLIAAERCGRRAHLVEFDPLACDRIIQRFEIFTGKRARHEGTDESFEDVAAMRAKAPSPAPAVEELA